jgi:hypothetical protein
MTAQDREKIRDLYDAAGENEWTRLDRDPRGRVAYEVHRRFLRRFIKSGARGRRRTRAFHL